MHKLQVQLLYTQFNWPVKNISEAIGQPVTYVQSIIEELELQQGEALPVITDENLPAEEKTMRAMREHEIKKQELIAPILAITEIELLHKLSKVISAIDVDNPDAHIALANLVKSYKQMTQDTIANKVVQNEVDGNKPAVTVQVMNYIA